MASSVQKQDVNREIIELLEQALLKEREFFNSQLEHRHRLIVGDVSKQLFSTSSASSTNDPTSNSDTVIVAQAPPSGGIGVDEGTMQTDDPVQPPSTPEEHDSPKGSSSHATRKMRKSATPVFASRSQLDVEGGSKGLFERYSRAVNSTNFEIVFGVIIVISAIIMGIEMQYRGIDTGVKVGYPAYDTPAAEVWPWAKQFFVYAEWVLGILFSLELVAKLIANRRQFLCEFWNWIDVLIVCSWLSTVIVQQDNAFNPNILRILRLMRLLRLLRLLGMISVFDSLYLMTTAIKGSLSVLIWAVLVLTVVQMTIACLLQAAVEDHLRMGDLSQENAFEVYMHFGSFARSMLAMFELTLGNWIVPTRALVEHVSEWYLLLFLWHKFFIGFSVVSVITGVFIQETFKVATSDDQILLNNKTRAMRENKRKMTKLFKYADNDGDGSLDQKEFQKVMDEEVVRKWLSSMGLDVDDVETLFELFAGGDSKVTAEELVVGAGRLKGSARSIDLMTFVTRYRHDHEQIIELLKHRDLYAASSNMQRQATPVTI
mmetsp:Transcript_114107/g.227063  ORF Transcript_114107/g.227063 Transcript_114107/m.227063 type:complete len:544 (-) Transcript_114107:882-2513(-)|eukprot:CAMPEP_0172680010 /NCGR_PEP_ID=MMETSP1074-20121228/16460_1 /TAXON_ID=2916 /ORGANISM="Ceratium fusus, Strain PA161109" /LENGTH=543 /DNA_ID=CAMNT_0013498265 /DNA_START=68 /DNA_END=1699 /DNA_ORIENTATION=-